MTSTSKISSNQANARSSTGPKTAKGSARSARNAFRHGLSLPVLADPTLSQEVATLAREIAGTNPGLKIRQLARQVAEAEIDLRRVRFARHRLICNALRDPDYQPSVNIKKKTLRLSAFSIDLIAYRPRPRFLSM